MLYLKGLRYRPVTLDKELVEVYDEREEEKIKTKVSQS